MLSLLDPERDIELFREAFGWRPEPKEHVGANRAPFEAFISTDPRQIVIGLLNPEFIAAFVFYEFEPAKYECHFTSKKGVSRETLLDGAKEIIDCLYEGGAEELVAWIQVRNRALRSFVEDLGFIETETKDFPKNKDSDSDSVSTFVKYVLYG